MDIRVPLHSENPDHELVLFIDDVDFELVHRFRNSLTANVLVQYCKLNFI